LQHCDPWAGDGARGADIVANCAREAHSAAIAAIDHRHDCYRIDCDGTSLDAAHFSEVMVWSLAYAIVGAAPAGADPVYFAFVNYTTLGYGDVTPVERWRLLGPITAMNGVLLFGWSTAVIFEVLRRTARRGD
jgi:Ion channel